MKRIGTNRVISTFFAFGAIALVIVLNYLTEVHMRRLGIGVCNDGISFNLLSWLPGLSLVLSSVVIILALLIFMMSFRVIGILWLGAVFVIAGGVANLVSRILWGCVWDWIPLGASGIYSNISDIIINIGLILVVIGAVVSFRSKKMA